MLIVTVLMITVLSLLGIKYAVLLGLVAGIFNVVGWVGEFDCNTGHRFE